MYFKPEPDVIFRPSEQLREMITYGKAVDKIANNLKVLQLSPSISEIRMILKEVFIADNRDPGKGDIYLVTVVTDSFSSEPFTLSVKTFEDVPDKSALTLGPSGLVFYRNEVGKIPRFLDYRILVMESDHELRSAGEVINTVRKDPVYDELKKNVIAITGAAQPTVALISAAADALIGVFAKVLQSNRDDQIAYIVGSFDDKFDDLGTKYGLIAQKTKYAKVSYQVEAG